MTTTTLLTQLVEVEAQRRQAMWRDLLAGDGPSGVPASLIRDLGIVSGYRGIWVDKQRTAPLTVNGAGVAVGLLHTGEHYADDLSADGVLYHYPVTQVPGRDANEVQAIKNASLLGLPLFVITTSPDDSTKRDVFPGIVSGWDDEAKWFLIEFKTDAVPARPAPPTPEPDSTPVRLFDELPDRLRLAPGRLRQQRFKFEVISRYGAKCAVCDVCIVEMLQAAHIIPRGQHGSYDPRNGIVFCANHHHAFDAGLFAVEPRTRHLAFPAGSYSRAQLNMTTDTLRPLRNYPDPSALEWRWRKWQEHNAAR